MLEPSPRRGTRIESTGMFQISQEDIEKAEVKALHKFRSSSNLGAKNATESVCHSYISTEGWGEKTIKVGIDDGRIWHMAVNNTTIHFWTGDKENIKVIPRAAITMIEVEDTDEIYQGGGPILKCLAACCGCKCLLPPPVISKGSILSIYTAQSPHPAKEVHMNDDDIPYIQQLLDTVI